MPGIMPYGTPKITRRSGFSPPSRPLLVSTQEAEIAHVDRTAAGIAEQVGDASRERFSMKTFN